MTALSRDLHKYLLVSISDQAKRALGIPVIMSTEHLQVKADQGLPGSACSLGAHAQGIQELKST